MAKRNEEEEDLPLSKSAEYLLAECRTVLPGIQAVRDQAIAGGEGWFSPTQVSLAQV